MLRNITAQVQVVIPFFSILLKEHIEKLKQSPELAHLVNLSGLNGAPTVNGQTPIPPDIARLLLGKAKGFERVLTDPVKGLVITADQYTPTESVKRLLTARDLHCRFPGCRMPTKYCKIDHTQDWALGGTTVPENLAHLCLRHHGMKHGTDWSVKQLPGGILEWTSPLGDTTLDEPVSTVIFQPTDTERDTPAPF